MELDLWLVVLSSKRLRDEAFVLVLVGVVCAEAHPHAPTRCGEVLIFVSLLSADTGGWLDFWDNDN